MVDARAFSTFSFSLKILYIEYIHVQYCQEITWHCVCVRPASTTPASCVHSAGALRLLCGRLACILRASRVLFCGRIASCVQCPHLAYNENCVRLDALVGRIYIYFENTMQHIRQPAVYQS